MTDKKRCAAMVEVPKGVYSGPWLIGWKRQCKRNAVSGDFCGSHLGMNTVRWDREKHMPPLKVREIGAR